MKGGESDASRTAAPMRDGQEGPMYQTSGAVGGEREDIGKNLWGRLCDPGGRTHDGKTCRVLSGKYGGREKKGNELLGTS